MYSIGGYVRIILQVPICGLFTFRDRGIMKVGEYMRLQNSYIFLMNPNNQSIKKSKPSDHKRIFECLPSVYSYVSECFQGITEYEIEGWDYQHKMVWKSDDSADKCTVVFRFYCVVGSTYLDVAAEGESEENVIRCLENLHEKLQSSGVCSDYVMIVSFDATSEYYCNKLYPKLNGLERNLRKLLFNIYTVNFGKEYYRTTISEQIQSKAKEIIQAKGGASKRKVTVLQEFFYSLEFGDINQMLFTPRWTALDEENKRVFLDEHKDLSILSDSELRKAIAEITPKSDWDRFFSDKVSNVDFQGAMDKIRGYRNKVAHCKFVTQSEYQECVRVIEELNDVILVAIRATEEKDFANKNNSYLQKIVKQLADSLQNLSGMYSSMANSVLGAIESAVYSMRDLARSIDASGEIGDEGMDSRDSNDGDAMLSNNNDTKHDE